MTRKHTLTATPERLPNVTASKKYTVQHRDKFGFANVSVVPTTGDLSTDDPAFVLPGGRNIVLHVGSSETLAASWTPEDKGISTVNCGGPRGVWFPPVPASPCIFFYQSSSNL